MSELMIYGASDDLIEIEGDAVEEYSAAAGVAVVAVSTGDLIRFRFEPEGWRATLVHDATRPEIARNDRGDDVVIIYGPIVAWVVVQAGDDGPGPLLVKTPG